MKENKGITMVALVITIVLLLILAGISIGQGNKVIKASELENLKTNMLLIKVKAKEYVENANFKLGTNFKNATDKTTRVENAKAELKGEEITDISTIKGNINISQETISNDYTYYYKLSTDNLTDIGITKVESNEKDGWYIIKYDIENLGIEIYNTNGFENEGTKYYSLTELQNVEL